MRHGIIATILAGTSLLAGGTAYAQSEPTPASAPAADDAGLQDIIVTAQRREESLQRVPVAVTAINADQIDQMRITNVKNLAGLAPSLQINTQGLQSNPTIILRGIASGTSNNAVDPKIGIYLDGVYIGRTVGSIFDLSDIARVEVLRGPQGTLFGRNATSGAISLVTAPPTGEFGVRGNISYGNYDAKRGKVTVDLPKIGPLALKISYLHDDIKGDYRNLIGGQTIDLSQRDPAFGTLTFAKRLGGRNTDAVQVAARVEAGNLTADYHFDYTDTRAVGRMSQSFGVLPDSSGALLGPIIQFQPALGGITNISPTRLDAVANASSVEHVVTQGHSLTLTLHANDNLTIKSISAFRKFRQDPNIYDLAASGGLQFTVGQMQALLTAQTPEGVLAGVFDPANMPQANDRFFSLLTARSTRQRQFSQEVQIQLTEDAYQLTAGVFYFHENSPATDILGIFQPVTNGVVSDNPILSMFPVGTPLAPFGIDINGDGVLDGRDVNSMDALFGSGVTRTLSINDSMAGYGQLTIHLNDQIDITGGLRYTIDDRQMNIYSISGGQGGQLGIGKYKVSFNKLNYTGILTWRPTSEITTYAKIASGYVAGGILSGIPYKPETLVSYEVGLKMQAFNNRLRANVSAYYSDYKDLQTQNFIDGVQFFDNAGKASIKGVELEMDAMPVRGLTLSGSLGYTKFNYKEFILVGQDVADVARTTYSAKWTARASAQYDAPEFANGSNVYGRVDARYKGRAPLVSTPIVDLTGAVSPLENYAFTKAYWLLDGRLGLANFAIGGAKTSLSVFGQNLLNTHYNPFGAPVLQLTSSYERGRTYGVELGFAF